MSPIPAQGYWEAIIAELGGDTPDNRCAKLLPVLWAARSNYALLDPYLQVLYVKLDCCDIILGAYREQVTMDQGGYLEMSLSDQSRNVQVIRANIMADIAQRMAQATASMGSAVGQLTAQTPIPSPFAPYDPCDTVDRRLRGDAFLPERRGWGRGL